MPLIFLKKDVDDAIIKKVPHHSSITVLGLEEIHSLKPVEHKPLVREPV